MNSREAVNVDLPENQLFGRDAVVLISSLRLLTDCNDRQIKPKYVQCNTHAVDVRNVEVKISTCCACVTVSLDRLDKAYLRTKDGQILVQLHLGHGVQ